MVYLEGTCSDCQHEQGCRQHNKRCSPRSCVLCEYDAIAQGKATTHIPEEFRSCPSRKSPQHAGTGSPRQRHCLVDRMTRSTRQPQRVSSGIACGSQRRSRPDCHRETHRTKDGILDVGFSQATRRLTGRGARTGYLLGILAPDSSAREPRVRLRSPHARTTREFSGGRP